MSGGPGAGPSTVGTVGDGWRLMLGTLTVLPVRPPARLDRPVAACAMVLAPLGGLLLAVVVAGLLVLAGLVDADPLIAAALAVGLLAVLTRAIHLDGLADTADGLGSRQSGAAALAIMRKSDIGPFGVVTLVLALLLQVAALRQGLLGAHGPLLMVVALVVSRGVLAPVCTRWFAPARSEGLGSTVAGTVGGIGLLVAGLILALVLAIASAVGLWTGTLSPAGLAGLGVAAVGGPLSGLALTAYVVRRIGGVTGDVMGAAVETSFTAALVLGALVG